jgi:hypothetical protein
VVGSLTDLSVAYYNPGALALLDDPSSLLSAKAFEYQTVTVQDGAGVRTGLSESRFGPSPSLFATLIPVLEDEREQLAFTVFTRSRFRTRLNARTSGQGDVVELLPGLETYFTEALYDRETTEVWAGVNWSRAVGPGLGIGVTPFLASLSHRTRIESVAQAEGESGAAASTLIVDDLDYTHWRLVLKAGVAWEGRPLTLGMTVTTPGLGLGFMSGGKAHFNRAIIGQDIDGDGSADNYLYHSTQEDLDADYHSPLSIAIGGAYQLSSTRLHLTAEWFDAVGRYVVLDASDLTETVPGVTPSRRLMQERRSTFNAGIGLEHSMRRGFEIYGAFTTDYSSVVRGSGDIQSATAWDIFHVTAGAAGRIGGLDLTFGFGHSFGSAPILSQAEIAGVDNDRVLLGRFRGEIDYTRQEYIIGFAFTI